MMRTTIDRRLIILTFLMICTFAMIIPVHLAKAQGMSSQMPVWGNDISEILIRDLDAISPQAVDAITLVSFYVEYYSDEDQVFVIWETATELDTSGFRVWRSVGAADGTYEPVSPFIQAEGGLVSMYYEWEDVEVTMGHIYYYKLEEFDTNNVSVNFYGPVQFDYFSPTATLTSTGTQTVIAGTATLTPRASKTPTATATGTLFPTSTRQSFTATITPEVSPQPDNELIRTAIPITITETIQPLPADQLMFPALTETITSTELAMLQTSSGRDNQDINASLEVRPNLTTRTRFLGGVVLLLWVVLAAFLVLYLRKIHGY